MGAGDDRGSVGSLTIHLGLLLVGYWYSGACLKNHDCDYTGEIPKAEYAGLIFGGRVSSSPSGSIGCFGVNGAQFTAQWYKGACLRLHMIVTIITKHGTS